MEHLDGIYLSQNRHSVLKTQHFCLIDDIFYRHNYAPDIPSWLLGVPADLRNKVYPSARRRKR